VLNNYPTVTNMNNEKFWHMLWQYAASHTPEWGVLVGGIKINVSSSKTLRPYLFDGKSSLYTDTIKSSLFD